MSSSGEAHDPDPLWVDAPLFRSAPYQADRPLCIEQGTRGRLGLRFARAAWHAILQDHPGDSQGVQPRCHLFAFLVPRQVPVTPARTYQDRDPCPVRDVRMEHGNCRPRHVCDPLRVFCRRFGRCPHTFRTDLSVIPHGLSRPDIKHQRRTRRLCRTVRIKPDGHARQDEESLHRRCPHCADRRSPSLGILRALRQSVKNAGAGRRRSAGRRPTNEYSPK